LPDISAMTNGGYSGPIFLPAISIKSADFMFA
jgi:hypothetical protein